MPRAKTIPELATEPVIDSVEHSEVSHDDKLISIPDVKPERKSVVAFLNELGETVTVPVISEDDHLYNTLGEKVPFEDYFYSDGKVPIYETIKKHRFVSLGKPVDREDLIAVFNDFFNPKDGILLYKDPRKELFIFIIPIKYSGLSRVKGNLNGDVQLHSVSFMMTGGVNVDLFKVALKKLVAGIGYRA